jgi:ATP-binding cassette subfamily C protein
MTERLLQRGTAFLRRRPGTLGTLAFCSLLESGQTFLFGYAVAGALDHGFLAGRPVTGICWLAIAAAAAVIGAGGTANSYLGLAGLTEPLRDSLVRRVVSDALRTAVAATGRSLATSDTAAVSRLTHQVELARDSFAGLVTVARSFAFTAVGALAGLATLAPVLLLLVLPPVVAGLALFAATLRPMAVRQREFLLADERIAARAGEVVEGLRDVAACGAEQAACARVLPAVDAEARASRALARWSAARALALGVGGRLPVVLLLVTAPWLLRRGVTVGDLAGALTYLTQSLLPAQQALSHGLGATGTRLVVVLRRLLDAAPASGEVPEATSEPDEPPSAAVELRGVRFGYGGRAEPVLRGLDLSVPAGGHLAVVGPSGIGKSTLAALISGLRRPDAGVVRPAGGRALIPQEAYVFSGSLRENLVYLRPDPDPDPDPADAAAADTAAAVELFGLGPVAARLGGLDAPFDPAGARLSLGERQSIALARVWLTPPPLFPLTVLDEATSGLDPAAEARAERAFAQRAKTAAPEPPAALIVIAHRLSSALRADRVLLMDGGRPLLGTHGELLARSALYRDLVGHWTVADSADDSADEDSADADSASADDAAEPAARRL